ncbi:hypothetical protein [Lichenifustis flavocetrariae]|uniref:Uncharacterized protein n=1 Tax=Lichenifustis flavocetrariae TaxID=2949735 RepID=A0AA42CLE7_9HYPH|nr:hypothetical protein [Lichenifustis flavocetrariae]MCW6511539.1 hypothetical protein [Lichenifustis flavocetrariae]
MITILTASSAVAGIWIVTVLLLTVAAVFSLLGNFVSESVVLVWCWVAVSRAEAIQLKRVGHVVLRDAKKESRAFDAPGRTV